MTIQNPELEMTLDEAVGEVLGLLTGLDLGYDPTYDRYRAIARQLNRALRSMALEKDWSFYADVEDVGTAMAGDQELWLPPTVRPRIVNDDAVRLVDPNGQAVLWAYFLPRDALSKYSGRKGLWVASVRDMLLFSRPFTTGEDGLDIQVPVVREPRMFQLPPPPEGDGASEIEISDEVRNQLVDFPYPDVIIMRAAFYYAQTDPVMQPRVQTLEAQMKDMMYQLLERDDRSTDAPYLNDFQVPIQSSLRPSQYGWEGQHPHSDERR